MKRKIKKIIKKVIRYTVITLVAGFIFVVLVFLYYAMQVPDVATLIARPVSESTKIYDRTGQIILFDVHGDEKRTIVAWENVGDAIKSATVAAEDDKFYEHNGIDVNGILRSIYKDILSRDRSQGGSTITQQLIKNSIFSKEKTFSRKIKEMVFAVQVERKFSKDEILWMYLNQIPYGSNIYGIEAAASEFFGKSASELTNAEAALLASLPKAPTYYSPYGNHTDELETRKNITLNRMFTLEFITEEELELALEEEIEVLPPSEGIRAPHFVMMVREYLIEKYGEDTVQNGGLRVITTLDMDLQTLAEETVTQYGDSNEARYGAGNLAFAAADPRTGQILALVGSRDYFDVENEGNFNVATASRQPGSSFKPFAYATAFDNGFTDSTILFDVPTEFNPICSPSANQTKVQGQNCYNPNNYSGVFSGPVTMRQALARSLNVPSVKTLYLAGIQNTIDTATRMGITTLDDPSRFGLSLVLGGAEVKLVDMIAGYGTIANDGIAVKQTIILEVATSDGRILEEYEKDEQRVLDRQVARLLNDILSDNNARSPVFGYNSSLHIAGRQVAAKTGTTQENRDGWTVGYTPTLVAGVWGGNNDNSRMYGTATGAGVSAPAWKTFMIGALSGAPNVSFPKPDPIVVNKTMLNGVYNGPLGIHSILFYVDADNPQGSMPPNPYKDPQFTNWESAVQLWVGSAFGHTPAPSPNPQFTVTPDPNPTSTPIPVPVF
ncbi:MAG: transglycosylase domain-containing protein [Parcubacteria group bacterium]